MKNILLNETAVATFGQLFIPKSGHTVNRVEYTSDPFETVLNLVSVQKDLTLSILTLNIYHQRLVALPPI